MTTVELARFVTRHTTISDIASLEPGKALEMVDAINHGIQTFFSLAPDHFSRTTISRRVDAPMLAVIEVMDGSSKFAGFPYTRNLRGCSIRIDGDATINEIVGPGMLLHAYNGPTGERSATVWYDSVAALDFQIESLVSHPIVVDRRKPLIPIPTRDMSLIDDGDLRGVGDFPTHYLLEYVGGAIDAEEDAVFQLRLLPRPGAGCTLKIEAKILPLVYGIADLTEARKLPIAPAHCSQLLIPLVEERLALSTVWRDTSNASLIMRQADDAKARISTLPRYARSKTRIRTKPGW